MNGFSVEPGERSASVMSTWPARRIIEVVGGTDPSENLAGGIVDRHDARPRGAARAQAPVRAPDPPVALQRGVDGSR